MYTKIKEKLKKTARKYVINRSKTGKICDKDK